MVRRILKSFWKKQDSVSLVAEVITSRLYVGSARTSNLTPSFIVAAVALRSLCCRSAEVDLSVGKAQKPGSTECFETSSS